MTSSGTIRIGSGAGFADDRIEPARELAEKGRLNYLVFECLAERTIALAQLDKRRDPRAGYNEWLPDRMHAVLPACVEQGITIITNMGAANPAAAAHVVQQIAHDLGYTGLKIATVTGDDVLEQVKDTDLALMDRDGTVRSLGNTVISANAYLGCEGIVQALDSGADIVITGRVSDPSLYLAPLIHEFQWSPQDWDTIGKGIAVGHLLECGAQVSGGYFADPGRKDVPDLARIGFPIAEVAPDGSCVISKPAGSGGRITVATCTEQILYEVHNPARYISADAVADFSGVSFQQTGPDEVAVFGATGSERPDALKVSIGYLDSYIGEGEISYAGTNAVARGRLALDIVKERLEIIGVATTETRFDLIGVDSVLRGTGTPRATDPAEVRIRVAGRTSSPSEAARIGREVSALWLNGPAGGAGATRNTREVIAIASVLLPRTQITPIVDLFES